MAHIIEIFPRGKQGPRLSYTVYAIIADEVAVQVSAAMALV